MNNKAKFMILLALISLLVFIVGKVKYSNEIIYLSYGLLFSAALALIALPEYKNRLKKNARIFEMYNDDKKCTVSFEANINKKEFVILVNNFINNKEVLLEIDYENKK